MNPHDVQIQSCFVSVSVVTGPQVTVHLMSEERAPEGGREAPTTPRPAATIILLRRGGKHAQRGLEVLLAKRADSQSFMPGVWVFPGGMVEDGEEYAACAVRELEEETGIALAADAEVLPWMRWITPEVVPVRFDTLFYVGLAPAHSPPKPDGVEISDAGWFSPRGALEAHEADELELVFPTIKTLETLLPYANAQEVLAAAPGRSLDPVLPRVVGTREDHRIVLPWEDGYEDAAADVDSLQP
jgi:8-oxo-dGTP pyrophosphatase MutT (NUDIX family)